MSLRQTWVRCRASAPLLGGRLGLVREPAARTKAAVNAPHSKTLRAGDGCSHLRQHLGVRQPSGAFGGIIAEAPGNSPGQVGKQSHPTSRSGVRRSSLQFRLDGTYFETSRVGDRRSDSWRAATSEIGCTLGPWTARSERRLAAGLRRTSFWQCADLTTAHHFVTGRPKPVADRRSGVHAFMP